MRPARRRHKLGRWKAWREGRVKRGRREEGEKEVTVMNRARFTLEGKKVNRKDV